MILLTKNISAVTAYNYSSVKLFDFSVTCYGKHFMEDAKLFTILYLYKCGNSAPALVFLLLSGDVVVKIRKSQKS